TGAMYRSVTWWCLDQGIDLTDREAVARAAEEIDLVQGTDPSGATVVVAGTDITAEIRTQRISQQVSAVATNTLVRAILQRRQRELFFAAAAERGFCVAEGRDITTVVAPDAHVRVLLTASDEERMRRRAAELDLEDNEDTRARMADQVLRRDRDDATVSEFHTAAEGVEAVDTTGLGLQGGVGQVVILVAAESAEAEARGEESAVESGAAPRTGEAEGPTDEEIEAALRAGLSAYDLDAEDLALLTGQEDEAPRLAPQRNLPVVAVVGRPNV